MKKLITVTIFLISVFRVFSQVPIKLDGLLERAVTLLHKKFCHLEPSYGILTIKHI